MTIYLAARFLHVLGALAVFAGVGLEIAILRGLTLAQSETATQTALAGLRIHKRVGMAAMLLVLVPGGYMASAAWGMPAWLLAATGAMVTIGVLETIATRSSLAALTSAFQRGTHGGNTEKLLQRLWASFAARAVLLLGIVGLMSMKPGWPRAILTLAVTGSTAALAASFAQRASRRAGDHGKLVHD